jgi:hypothetical protein
MDVGKKPAVAVAMGDAGQGKMFSHKRSSRGGRVAPQPVQPARALPQRQAPPNAASQSAAPQSAAGSRQPKVEAPKVYFSVCLN